jgi:hypothetical protein
MEYQRNLHLIIGEAKVASLVNGRIRLMSLLFEKGGEEKYHSEEYDEFPIDPADAEYFADLDVYAFSDPDYPNMTSGKKKFGMFRNQKLYLRKIKFVSKVDLGLEPLVVHDIRSLDTIFQGCPGSIHFGAEFVRIHNAFLPGLAFFLKRVEQLFSIQFETPYQILGRFCPQPVRTEVTAICTDRGPLGFIDADGTLFISGQYTEILRTEDDFGDSYRSCFSNILIKKQIPFSEVDEEILSEFRRKNEIMFGDDVVATCIQICSEPLGLTCGIVVNQSKSMIELPNIFTKKAKLLPTTNGGVEIALGGLVHKIYSTRSIINFVYYLFEKFIRPSLQEKHEKLWQRRCYSSFDNWGLFDHSLVIFPNSDSVNIFYFDETDGYWKRQAEIMKTAEQIVSICLTPLDAMMETFLTATELPADLCRLIIETTYDYFPGDFQGSNKIVLRNDLNEVIDVAEIIQFARRMLA